MCVIVIPTRFVLLSLLLLMMKDAIVVKVVVDGPMNVATVAMLLLVRWNPSLLLFLLLFWLWL